MDLELVAGIIGLGVACGRWIVAYRRKESVVRTAFNVPVIFLSGLAIGLGICTVPYLFVAKTKPEWLTFYANWPANPWFVTFAGIAYLMGGMVAAGRNFRDNRR